MTLAKRLVLFFLLTIPVGRVAAEDAAVLRVLLVIDTNAGKVGGDEKAHRESHSRNLNYMLSVINDVHNSELKGRIFVDTLKDEEVTPANIRKFYRETVGRDPRCHLLFYYTGHGGFDRKLGHFLCMSGGYILRREIYNLMADTGAPGIFILTDCCSNYCDFCNNGTTSRNSLFQADSPLLGHGATVATGLSLAMPLRIASAATVQQTVQPRTNVSLFYALFYRQHGLVSITSTTEGQISWSEHFTLSLCNNLGSNAFRTDGKSGSVTWESFYRKVRNSTNSRFHANQFPVDAEARKQAAQIPQAFSLGAWPRNYRRQLQVKNETGQRIRVWVKYYQLEFSNDTWHWREPDGFYTLAPGAVTTLRHNKQIVGGHKVRIWAQTEDGSVSWDEYRNQDLFLTPQEGFVGQVDRFAFTFNAVSE